jgi:hypothetical protein
VPAHPRLGQGLGRGRGGNRGRFFRAPSACVLRVDATTTSNEGE